ncbi:MAG: hypothetical protein LUG24_05985 [Clostridiales bacterium]|nr:hypothetical protein [Clostridiales bacterium]
MSGSLVWLGTYPKMERAKNQQELFGLPENIIPHSIIAFGYPGEAVEKEEERNLYEGGCVHRQGF